MFSSVTILSLLAAGEIDLKKIKRFCEGTKNYECTFRSEDKCKEASCKWNDGNWSLPCAGMPGHVASQESAGVLKTALGGVTSPEEKFIILRTTCDVDIELALWREDRELHIKNFEELIKSLEEGKMDHSRALKILTSNPSNLGETTGKSLGEKWRSLLDKDLSSLVKTHEQAITETHQTKIQAELNDIRNNSLEDRRAQTKEEAEERMITHAEKQAREAELDDIRNDIRNNSLELRRVKAEREAEERVIKVAEAEEKRKVAEAEENRKAEAEKARKQAERDEKKRKLQYEPSWVEGPCQTTDDRTPLGSVNSKWDCFKKCRTESDFGYAACEFSDRGYGKYNCGYYSTITGGDSPDNNKKSLIKNECEINTLNQACETYNGNQAGCGAQGSRCVYSDSECLKSGSSHSVLKQRSFLAIQ